MWLDSIIHDNEQGPHYTAYPIRWTILASLH